MVYRSVSIDEVIGRVIRNTRVQDSAYIIDMHEWIPEAMRLLECKQQLIQLHEDLTTKFHKVRMPCGLQFIDAIEYKCHRLPHGNSVKDIHTPQPRRHDSNGPFISVIGKQSVPDGNTIWVSTIEELNRLPFCDDAYYQTELDHILTSFDCGPIRVHYHSVPVDARGLPLIPDNENFKEALYWWVRDRMQGAGFHDPVYKEGVCFQKFEFYSARAIGEITYPSPDEMEQRVNTLSRFIPPENYYENFFKVSEPEPMIRPTHRYDNRIL